MTAKTSHKDLSELLEADLPTIVANAAASEIDHDERRLNVLLGFLRHRVLKLMRSREEFIPELKEYAATLDRMKEGSLLPSYPWFIQSTNELLELLMASEEYVDVPMAIKRHLPLSWKVLRRLHQMKGTSLMKDYTYIPHEPKEYRKCLSALIDAGLVAVHDYSYRLDRTFEFVRCNPCYTVDYVRGKGHVPVCRNCGCDMRIFKGEELEDACNLTLLLLTESGEELMQKVEDGECVF
ncbi:MAG: hypothetical protein AAB400_04735 [Patescibacteria group bacterium]